MDDFDYGRAEADLYDSGCPDSEEIYGYRSKKGIDAFMRENGLSPDKYYRNSGNSTNSSNNNGGCYITSACVHAKSLPDNCYELRTLRTFRDTYLKSLPSGTQDIAEYYRISPQIVERINQLPDAEIIWNSLYQKMIVPCLQLIKNNRLQDAYLLYKTTTLQLKTEYLV